MAYPLNLTEEDRKELQNIVKKGISRAQTIRRANILLLLDKGEKRDKIVEMLGCCKATIGNIKKSYIEKGLEATLEDNPRSGQPKKLDGRQEAMIIATACTNPPEGKAQWTLELLAERYVEFNVSKTTIGRVLKKTK